MKIKINLTIELPKVVRIDKIGLQDQIHNYVAGIIEHTYSIKRKSVSSYLEIVND